MDDPTSTSAVTATPSVIEAFDAALTAPVIAPDTHRRISTFSSLSHPNYRYLWTGTLFMSLGQWIQQVTLGYYVYDLTGSSVLLGLLQTVRALPFLLLNPIVGVMVDRVDRRK